MFHILTSYWTLSCWPVNVIKIDTVYSIVLSIKGTYVMNDPFSWAPFTTTAGVSFFVTTWDYKSFVTSNSHLHRSYGDEPCHFTSRQYTPPPPPENLHGWIPKIGPKWKGTSPEPQLHLFGVQNGGFRGFVFLTPKALNCLMSPHPGASL